MLDDNYFTSSKDDGLLAAKQPCLSNSEQEDKKTVKLVIQSAYRIAGIYYESFNFANFANRKALAKIKASIHILSILNV